MRSLTKYRFSFGPWNIHTGADPFGPPVRQEYSFTQKLKFYKKLGFDGVQFHDDDAGQQPHYFPAFTGTGQEPEYQKSR